VIVLFISAAVSVWAQDVPAAPKLLLNAQRLRRLRRDRERKTPRWVNFENRINSVPDSPERGFELALYYAITGDEAKGREAVKWAINKHDFRVMPLVLDWCGALLSDEQRKKLTEYLVLVKQGDRLTIREERDIWFQTIASGREIKSPPERFLRDDLDRFSRYGDYDYNDLYSLCELIYVIRAATRADLRATDSHFFAILPELLLLSVKPPELNSPDWKMHVAALALVAIDPNLPSSQFLQSWALEDAQMLREGPGVAYELLWADPYLPGVGYQNMEPWTYDDEHDRLLARASWEPNSCWVDISPQGVKEENCPPHWQSQTVTFGHLTLIPMTERCVEIPHVSNRNDSVLVWKLKPGEGITHGTGKEKHTTPADAAGIWRPGSAIEGKVCIASH